VCVCVCVFARLCFSMYLGVEETRFHVSAKCWKMLACVKQQGVSRCTGVPALFARSQKPLSDVGSLLFVHESTTENTVYLRERSSDLPRTSPCGREHKWSRLLDSAIPYCSKSVARISLWLPLKKNCENAEVLGGSLRGQYPATARDRLASLRHLSLAPAFVPPRRTP